MRTFKSLAFLVVVGSLLSIILLFVIQNMDQEVELGLNLGFIGAWRLAEPQPAVFILLGAFALGFVLVGLFAVYEVILFERKVRRLNGRVQELEAGGAGSGASA